jgi:hypothetical protein
LEKVCWRIRHKEQNDRYQHRVHRIQTTSNNGNNKADKEYEESDDHLFSSPQFHVSTMLPFNEQDKQQLERKRHIGNGKGL